MTMTTVDQLIEQSRDPRLRRQPVYVQNLIHELAHRLEAEHAYAQAVIKRAESEVDEARKIAAEGPEDSDTFLSLPGSLLSSADDYEQKSLGTGAKVEFRAPGLRPGEGFQVRMKNGHLKITGMSSMAVIPQDRYTIVIEER